MVIHDVNIRGTEVRGISEIFILFLQSLCKPKIISKKNFKHYQSQTVSGFCFLSNGVSLAGFQKVGQGPMDVKTKHSFLRISNIGRDVEAEFPFGQMGIAVATAIRPFGWSL